MSDETSDQVTEVCTIKKFVADTGISKSTIYRLVAEGKLTMRKMTRGLSVIDMGSARHYFSTLPPVETPRSKRPNHP